MTKYFVDVFWLFLTKNISCGTLLTLKNICETNKIPKYSIQKCLYFEVLLIILIFILKYVFVIHEPSIISVFTENKAENLWLSTLMTPKYGTYLSKYKNFPIIFFVLKDPVLRKMDW